MKIIDLTDLAGQIVEADWLSRAESVHRQLRPQLPANYPGRMQEIFSNSARMAIAVVAEKVVGVAVWRLIENTYAGRVLYVDDLVTDEAQRSNGVGKALLAHCETLARQLECKNFELDSGTQRTNAHRFYFREGMVIDSFHFRKSL